MKYEYVKFLITEESKPESIAERLSKKAADYGKNGTFETEIMLKGISKQAKGNKKFPIGNGNFIDPKNPKEVECYINSIINLLDIKDKDIKRNVINTIYKLREFLPLAYDGKLL